MVKGINYDEAYATAINTVNDKWHRSPIILHKNSDWYLGEFKTAAQFEKFAAYMGFSYELMGVETWNWLNGETVSYYKLSHKFREGKCHKSEYCGMCEGFWDYSELPSGAKPIIVHSNGSLVTGFFTNDGETITIYRPNPNAKNVYIPMTTENHIKYLEDNGGL